MNSNLSVFVGKVCTIFTVPFNRTFNEKQMNDYFVGVVESVDSKVIVTTHPATGCKNAFLLDYVIGIAEEPVVDVSGSTIPKVIDVPPREIPLPKPGYGTFVDIEALQKLSKLSTQ